MSEDNVIVLSSVLTGLILGARQAVYTGIFQVGLVIPRHNNFRLSISRWAWSLFITIVIGTLLTHLLGSLWLIDFNDLEYFASLFLAIASLVGRFSRNSKLTSMLASSKLLYLLAIVQGIGVFTSLSALYAINHDVSLTLLSGCATIYFIAYAAIVSLFILIIKLLSESKPSAGPIVMVILSVLSILICLLHFLFQFGN